MINLIPRNSDKPIAHLHFHSYQICPFFRILSGLNELIMFGGGAGHIAEMIARIRQNRELQKQTRNRYKRLKDQQGHEKIQKVRVAAPELTKEELAQRRAELRARINQDKQRRNRVFVFAIIVGIIGCVLLYLLAQHWAITS